jgi:hypothetical protein
MEQSLKQMLPKWMALKSSLSVWILMATWICFGLLHQILLMWLHCE